MRHDLLLPLRMGLTLTLITVAACAPRSHPDADASAGDAHVDLRLPGDSHPDNPDQGAPPTLDLRVDGRFDDWRQTAPLATDPAGDATGAFDVTRLYAASRGTELFLRFDIGDHVRNLAAGGPGEGTLIITLKLAHGRTITLDLRGRRATVSSPTGTLEAHWLDLAYRAAPVYAAREFELGLDLATVGVTRGERVQISLQGSDAVGPSVLELIPPPLPQPHRALLRAPGTRLRIASQNTHFDGLLAAGRDARFGRLFRAVDADVYCLQELWKSSPQAIADKLAAFDPHGDGLPWNVHRGSLYGDTMIASRWPLTPLPNTNAAWTAAGITPPDGAPFVVVSMRLKCCGHLDSDEDQQRIAQVAALAAFLVDLRKGRLGDAALPFRDAPIIVCGDWNIVGARTPLTRLEDPLGPALTQAWIPKIVGNDYWTWREYGSPFPPSHLDIVVYSANRLKHVGGLVLDSDQLDDTARDALGLLRGDSLASDHLLVVADFGAR